MDHGTPNEISFHSSETFDFYSSLTLRSENSRVIFQHERIDLSA